MGKHNPLLKTVSNISFNFGPDLNNDLPVLLPYVDISAIDLKVLFHYIWKGSQERVD